MALISTIAGTRIESGHTYRVTYSGNRPRHDGAIWKFTFGGRASKDDQGNLVASAHGEIVSHIKPEVVEKFKGKDPYLSAQFEGTIEEVIVEPCVGYEDGSQLCVQARARDASGNVMNVPSTVIRDIPAVGVPRCGQCQREQQAWEAVQATQARQSSIDDSLAAAIARRTQVQAPAAPVVVAGPVIRQAVVEITPAGEDHPLYHLVPDYLFYEIYVSRTIHGKRDIDVLTSLAERGLNFLTEGPTESGKTALVTAWCALKRQPLVTVPCHGGIDATSIFSTKTLEDGVVRTVLSNATKVLQFGGVLNLDEINFAPQKVIAMLHEALDDRRQVSLADLGYETFNVHPQAFIVASYNGGQGYTGTVELNQATKRRFKQLTWDYDDVVERKLITRLPVLHALKDEIRSRIQTGDLDTPLGPAKLIQFEDDAVALNLDLAIQFFTDSFKDDVERGVVTELITHHRHDLERELAAVKVAQEDS